MKKYDLINYFDVWYNEEDGYTVNNSCVEKSGITITDDATAEDIINYLKQNGYVIQNCTVEDFEVEMFDNIEVYEKETGKPLYSFRQSYVKPVKSCKEREEDERRRQERRFKEEEERAESEEINMKVISKIFEVVENRNKCVAEVVENCGCGFEYLIRIVPDFKDNAEVFNKCLGICNIAVVGDIRHFIEESIDRGYVIRHEEIALIIDKIIE